MPQDPRAEQPIKHEDEMPDDPRAHDRGHGHAQRVKLEDKAGAAAGMQDIKMEDAKDDAPRGYAALAQG